GGWTVLGNRTFRNVQMDVNVAIEILRKSERCGARANVAHRGLRGFLHHFAELARWREAAFAFHDCSFGDEHGAADFGPGEGGRQTDFVVLFEPEFAVLENAEEVVDVFGGDFHLDGSFFGDYFARHLAGNVLNFAFEVSNAGFMCVVPDDMK